MQNSKTKTKLKQPTQFSSEVKGVNYASFAPNLGNTALQILQKSLSLVGRFEH